MAAKGRYKHTTYLYSSPGASVEMRESLQRGWRVRVFLCMKPHPKAEHHRQERACRDHLSLHPIQSHLLVVGVASLPLLVWWCGESSTGRWWCGAHWHASWMTEGERWCQYSWLYSTWAWGSGAVRGWIILVQASPNAEMCQMRKSA